MKKVVITGPESSGKSTLAKNLSESLFIPFVREYSREYIDNLKRPYKKEDLADIALGQIELERDVLEQTPSVLMCDTDLLTIKIWSEFKYGSCSSNIRDLLMENLPHLYVLCYPEMDWEYDPQRENPNNRKELFSIYESEIQKLKVPYVVLKGTESERLEKCMVLLSK